MRWTYACPKCKAMLNPDETIVLVGEHDGKRCLMGFHPEPGNYKVYSPPDVEIEKGDVWTFSCPVCGADLVSEQDDMLCAIESLSAGDSHLVLFSRKAGEKATFVVGPEGISEKHGKDLENYLPRLIQMKYL